MCSVAVDNAPSRVNGSKNSARAVRCKESRCSPQMATTSATKSASKRPRSKVRAISTWKAMSSSPSGRASGCRQPAICPPEAWKRAPKPSRRDVEPLVAGIDVPVVRPASLLSRRFAWEGVWPPPQGGRDVAGQHFEVVPGSIKARALGLYCGDEMGAIRSEHRVSSQAGDDLVRRAVLDVHQLKQLFGADVGVRRPTSRHMMWQ